MSKSDTIRIALLQLNVTKDKKKNVDHAVDNIRKIVKEKSPKVVVLPECFNGPYGTEYFDEFSEPVPDGYTCQQLSSVAKELGIYVIGGSIIEKDNDGKLYNTCTIWSPKGELIGKHRKVHLFDADVKGGVTFKESDVLTPGDDYTFLTIDNHKFGIGICADIGYEEFCRVYRNEGCEVFVFPSAFETYTGPIYWELYQKMRAVDNQVFVASVSPARDENASYVAYGHTMLVDPWSKIICEASEKEEILVADIDFSKVEEVRKQFPMFPKRRTDLYETIKKK